MTRDYRGEAREEPREFREEDRGKPIVAPAGIMVGTIGTVDPDRNRVTVERTEDDDSLTEEVKEWLGWGDDEGDREITHEHVDRYEDDRVYLRDRP
jgi:hypothetical protein